MDLNEFYKYKVNSVIVDTKTISDIKNEIDNLHKVNSELKEKLESSDKIIIYPGINSYHSWISKNNDNYSIKFIKDYLHEDDFSKSHCKEVLNLLCEFIINKLDESWFTRKFKSRILKALGL